VYFGGKDKEKGWKGRTAEGRKRLKRLKRPKSKELGDCLEMDSH